MTVPENKENLKSVNDHIEYYFNRDVADALVGIDLPHHEVHEGDFYTVSLAGTIAAGTATAFKLLIQPGPGMPVHLQGIVNTKNSGWLELRENSDIAGGTAKVPFNNNRNSANTFSGTVIYGGTITTLGTLLQPRAIGSASPGVRIGGEGDTRNEWILNPSYKYLLWFIADNADTQVSLDAEFYEHTVS